MEYYFKLQFILLKKTFKSNGLNIFVGLFFVLVSFVLINYFLNQVNPKYTYAIPFVLILILYKFGQKNRVNFLKTLFSKHDYLKVRLIENYFLATPFILTSFYQMNTIPILICSILPLCFAFFDFNLNTSFTLPSLFKPVKFEFNSGFRKYFIVFLLAYTLIFITISVNNFNLGIAGMILVGLTVYSFYFVPEDIYFVWIFKQNPYKFLRLKMIQGLISLLLLELPILIILGAYYGGFILIIGAIQLILILYLVAIIFSKYAAFPNEIGVHEGILLAISIVIPPLLVFTIPYFYKQSISQLKFLSHD